MFNLRLALLDVIEPSGGGIAWPSQQVALREHQEHGLAADLGPMTALLLQHAKESAELGEIRIDLCRRR
jgi:hypothetical protein